MNLLEIFLHWLRFIQRPYREREPNVTHKAKKLLDLLIEGHFSIQYLRKSEEYQYALSM